MFNRIRCARLEVRRRSRKFGLRAEMFTNQDTMVLMVMPLVRRDVFAP